MELALVAASPRKRLVSQVMGEAGDMVFKFRILLPNGCTTAITMQEPPEEMELADFIYLVRQEYDEHGGRRKFDGERPIKWDGPIYLEDMSERKIRNRIFFKQFKPNKLYMLRLHDECNASAHTFKNMWDLTPDTDLLAELPAQYTFEASLADLIDNSLQALWSKCIGRRRLISINVDDASISIIDTGPGMDGSDENSIVKWGKMGSSSHRAAKKFAVGGKPPYLTPYFGMFGYGGPIASMHLGRRSVVSSKTVTAKKVYTLHFERDALLKGGSFWRTDGGIRDPTEEEMEVSPHGSFTKVEIFELKQKCFNIARLQCRLKDIYFPYIQCDEMYTTGRTATPVEFQVNGHDLAEVDGGEIATTNLHSCNGPDFVFQVCFSRAQEATTSDGMLPSANARLKCVYFPIIKGKESIDQILEKLKTDGWEITENFKTFARVTIRRLGRLLPDARWGLIPFMEPKFKKGDKIQALKRCSVRVKCFIDADAGFSPTPSKTDLASHDSFTTALKHLGNKLTESDVSINVTKNGKKISMIQLEKEYMDWISSMHEKYDEEMDSGEDQPVIVVNPANAKKLGVSSDVVRVHKVITRNGQYWKSGQKIRISKDVEGVHKNNLYATLEYIVLEGFEGDSGRESRLICRPMGCSQDKGCLLDEGGDQTSLNIRESLSFPVSVIDLGKCEKVDDRVWNSQSGKHFQKSPSAIDILSRKLCFELDVGQGFPSDDIITAGHPPPDIVVAVIRPANFTRQASGVDQKFILKDDQEMIMKIVYACQKDGKDWADKHLIRVKASSHKGLHGLYLFSIRERNPQLFDKAGVYKFIFSLSTTSCQPCEIEVVVMPATAKTWEFNLSTPADERLFCVRNGEHAPPFSIVCYDAYKNQIPFEDVPEVSVSLKAGDTTIGSLNNFAPSLSPCRRSLEIKKLLVACRNLDLISPYYMATIEICSWDDELCAIAPCKVNPGIIHSIQLQDSSQVIKEFMPNDVIKQICLEVFDAYGNHVCRGTEVRVEVQGLEIQDFSGSHRKVDDDGYVNLNGLLKVVCGYGAKAYLIAYDGSRKLFEKEFQVARRELLIISEVPNYFVAGSRMENLVFHIVAPDGAVDKEINGPQHTIAVSSNLSSFSCRTQYGFIEGICQIPSVQIPEIEGNFSFKFYHSRHPELHANVKIKVMQAPKLEIEEADLGIMQTPCYICGRSSNPLPLLSASQLRSLMDHLLNEHAELNKVVDEANQRVNQHKCNLKLLESRKKSIDEEIYHMQESADPKMMGKFDQFMNAKELIVERIKKHCNSALSLFCDVPTAIKDKESKHLRDVIGIVALLGSVADNDLSRILAQYVGPIGMLGIVGKSYDTAVALKQYRGSGNARNEFLVISLEDIRPYGGGLDSQGKLVLSEPALPSGEKPPGFLDFAVNMIDLDIFNGVRITKFGYTLRETLFYRLFGDVQVYQTSEDMRKARSCIRSGAISFDGGIIRGNGLFSEAEREPEIVFPVVRPDVRRNLFQGSAHQAVDFSFINNKLSELHTVQREIDEVNDALTRAEKKCAKKSAKFQKFLSETGPLLSDILPLDSRPNGQ